MSRPRVHWRIRLQMYLDAAVPDGDCLIWPLAVNHEGYGQFGWFGLSEDQRQQSNAHNVVWQAAHGPLPDGWHVDHICRRRACVNLAHLEAVPPRENTLRGVGPSAQNAAKTHCPHGHAYTPENTRIVAGRRRCKVCEIVKQREYRARRRARA